MCETSQEYSIPVDSYVDAKYKEVLRGEITASNRYRWSKGKFLSRRSDEDRVDYDVSIQLKHT